MLTPKVCFQENNVFRIYCPDLLNYFPVKPAQSLGLFNYCLIEDVIAGNSTFISITPSQASPKTVTVMSHVPLR